jgi:hypothetical protein
VIRWREFIAGLGALATGPLAARAQQGDRVGRVGVLMAFDETDPEGKARFSGFTQRLAELGWTGRRNLWVDVRWAASNVDRTRVFAKELVGLKPDVILANSTPVTIDLIDRSVSKVHLVGHSYGGGVALHVALARPARIVSLALYEPSAFHLLKLIGDRVAFAEIADITRVTAQGVITGGYAGAVAAFVDYWGGVGAWATLRPTVQAALIRWAPKAPLDFHALIEQTTPLAAYGDRMPILIMRGEHAPPPTRKIAETLRSLAPEARLAVIDGAGHMGPFTHGSVVSELIAAHIDAAEAGGVAFDHVPLRSLRLMADGHRFPFVVDRKLAFVAARS